MEMNEITDLKLMISAVESGFQQGCGNWSDFNELLLQISVPRNTTIEERPFESADFTTISEIATECFFMLKTNFAIIRDLKIEGLNTCQLECVYRLILLCGEHSCNALWTNEETIRSSEQVLKMVLAALNFEDLSSFLTSTNSKKKLHGLNTFILLSPKLSKNEWQYYPAAVYCYSWLLRHIKSQMGEFLEVVLPVSLNIINNYQVENKIIALRCLRHIIRYISRAELNWHMQIELLINIMKPLYYYREANLIIPLIECTLEVINKTKSPFVDIEDLQWNYMDDILVILLTMMEYEQNIDRRIAYSQSLNLILIESKLSIVRWCPKLLRIIDDYSKTLVTEFAAINALNQLISICWPFLQNHWRLINVIAGRIIYRSTSKESIKLAEHVLQRLEQCISSPAELKSVEYIRNKSNYRSK